MREFIIPEDYVEGGYLELESDYIERECKELIRCKDCIHNVANRKTDPMDITDYSGQDIVCDYFMTDGQEPDDYCSKARTKETEKCC